MKIAGFSLAPVEWIVKSCVNIGGAKALIALQGAPQRPGIIYIANANESNAPKKPVTLVVLSLGSSCGKRIILSRYMPRRIARPIHNTRNVSRSRIPQPFVRSATERNFKANAISTKPSTTLMVFIQPPERGVCLSSDGKIAKTVNGKARAKAKPNMPTAGPR